MKPYDYKEIEARIQKKWEEEKPYKTINDTAKEKVYVLGMFPYPSGEGLHVGHGRIFTASDIYARKKRMEGNNVLFPTGWDAFGLPAEEFALKNKIHPRISTDRNIQNFRRQMKMLGLSYDFDREVDTTDPAFYKWSQWIFLKLYEKGLAYESYDPINWCPSCQTGLANEDLEGGKCERCGSVVEKKKMRQWTLRITTYADRLLNDLDLLEKWPVWLKELQRNWIGKSEGTEFTFDLVDGPVPSVAIFTTRADTLFGATFIAISAELASSWVSLGWNGGKEIEHYIHTTLEEQKEILDYGSEREKTGIATGLYAINPGTMEKIPVWIANYVIGGVGTGAIMAVPAHDGRDFDFAKKFSLPVKQVIAPETGKKQENPEFRKSIVAIVWDNKNNSFLSINWGKDLGGNLFIGGGIDGSEDVVDCAIREITEETGYSQVQFISKTGPIYHSYFAHSKNVARRIEATGLLFELKDGKAIEQKLEENEKSKFTVEWLSQENAESKIQDELHALVYQLLVKEKAYEGEGVLINSSTFDGTESVEARQKIGEALGGKNTTRYSLQDWVFSRQRYWGEPIPMVHDQEGKVYPLDESELPLVLPEVEHYEPTGTGESPLANIKNWVEVKGVITEKGTFKQDPQGKAFTRETNTMPQWAGSSWYYLRFADPNNDKELISKEKEKYWQPVDRYVGGAEHATRHLIYARFWHKFLFDIEVVTRKEPFLTMESVGLVLGPDGQKMSKRRGNVINPDDVVKDWGADTVRLYSAFMGSFYDATPWNPGAIVGCARFLERIYRMGTYIGNENEEIEILLHKTIKKVTEDIESFKFNTAISSLMIFLNGVEDKKAITSSQMKQFLQLLAPFAPHISEALFEEHVYEGNIHVGGWPMYTMAKTIDKEVTITFQVNGKLRGTFTLPSDLSDEEVKKAAFSTEIYAKYVGEDKPKKVIIVKNRLINIVI